MSEKLHDSFSNLMNIYINNTKDKEVQSNASVEKMHTDLYICVDEKFKYKYHARKLICKLREVYGKENSHNFYREYGFKGHTQDEKDANQYSFIVNSLLFN